MTSVWGTGGVFSILRDVPRTGQIDDKIVTMPPKSWDQLKRDVDDRLSALVDLSAEAHKLLLANKRAGTEFRDDVARLTAENDAANKAFRDAYAQLEAKYRDASQSLVSAQSRAAQLFSERFGIGTTVHPPPELPPAEDAT